MNLQPAEHRQQPACPPPPKPPYGTHFEAADMPDDGFTPYADPLLVRQVFEYYHEALWRSPRALAYLKTRQINDPALIETFRLGFADRTLGYRLPRGETAEGGAVRGYLQRVGVLRPSGHERFRGCAVFPVTDADGDVLDAYGRKITPRLRFGTAYHVTLADEPHGVFNQAALAGDQEIILCKSPLEAATFWCARFRNVVATMGLRGFSDELLKAFSRYGTARVYVAFDNTPAGDRAARLVAQALSVIGTECRRILFPPGLDANAAACASSSPVNLLTRLIREARPFAQSYEQLRMDAACR